MSAPDPTPFVTSLGLLATALLGGIAAIITAVRGQRKGEQEVDRTYPAVQPPPAPQPPAQFDYSTLASMWQKIQTLEAQHEADEVFRDVVDLLLPHVDTLLPNLTDDERRLVDRARVLRAQQG